MCGDAPYSTGRTELLFHSLHDKHVCIDTSVKASHVDLAEKELEHMMIMRLLAALYKLDKYPNSLFLCIHSLKIM